MLLIVLLLTACLSSFVVKPPVSKNIPTWTFMGGKALASRAL